MVTAEDEGALAICPKCDGSGRIEPDEHDYDGCDRCNYGGGPTGFVLRRGKEISAMSDWHHGYAAGDILRAVALAYEEAADNLSDLQDLPEFAMCTEFFRATSALITYRAKDLAPTAYDVIAEICSGLLHSGRTLIGTPFGSNRLDYLLCGIAHQQPDWIEPLKRRKSWLGPRDDSRTEP